MRGRGVDEKDIHEIPYQITVRASTKPDHFFSAMYSTSTDRWGIVNQDDSDVPEGASFNVLVLDPGEQAFTHEVGYSLLLSDRTTIDHPLLNDNPYALVYVTQQLNTSGGSPEYNDHPFGMEYNHSLDRWQVRNLDYGVMTEGMMFNLVVPTNQPAFFIHKAEAGTIFENYTIIDHPLLNNNPYAILQVTYNAMPDGEASTGGHDHALGVFYAFLTGRWAIFNQDMVDMDEGVSFNVYAPTIDMNVFTHFADSGNTNILPHATQLDNPIVTPDQDGEMFITSNWNPPGSGGEYNDEYISVAYNHIGNDVYEIINQDGTAIQDGVAFNVLMVPDSNPNAFRAVNALAPGDPLPVRLRHPLSEHNRTAIILVTQNARPKGAPASVYNLHHLGVTGLLADDGWFESWQVVNQDDADFPDYARFNVLVLGYKMYVPGMSR